VSAIRASLSPFRLRYGSTISPVTRQEVALIAQTRRELADGTARERREATGIRLVEFARLLGVSTPAVSQWERAVRVPGARHALAYGRELAALERRAA
jgi:DNA-binding transcriptional regulator YiaG